jgi:hypothetical protein
VTLLLAHIGIVPVEEFLGPVTTGVGAGVLVAVGSIVSCLRGFRVGERVTKRSDAMRVSGSPDRINASPIKNP